MYTHLIHSSAPKKRTSVSMLVRCYVVSSKYTAVQVTIVLGVVQCDLATAHVHHCKSSLGF